jgi:hypothetical protein
VSPQRIGSHAPTASIPLTAESTPLPGEVKSPERLPRRTVDARRMGRPSSLPSFGMAGPGQDRLPAAVPASRPRRARISQRRRTAGVLEDDPAGRDEDDQHDREHPCPVLQRQTLVVRPRRSFLRGCECRIAHSPHYRRRLGARLQPNGWTDLGRQVERACGPELAGGRIVARHRYLASPVGPYD